MSARKWLHELVLIRYWEDRCTLYKLKDGTAIRRARRSSPFGSYPDIAENDLSDGRTVPAEIEWLTTDFDRHRHAISTLLDNDGFIIVLKDDASALVERVEIDRNDFIEWFESHGRELAEATLAAVDEVATSSKEPQIFLYYVRSARGGERNLEIALERGIWGFPETDGKRLSGTASILEIKRGDIVVMIHGFQPDETVPVRGGRLSSEMFRGTVKSLYGLVVTKALYKDQAPVWPDGVYPIRFNFRKPPLFVGKDIPCTSKDLGPGLHEVLRRLPSNRAMQKIDGSSMTKLMSLCTRNLIEESQN